MSKPNSHKFEFITQDDLYHVQDLWYNGEISIKPSLIDFLCDCFEIPSDEYDFSNDSDPMSINIQEWVDAGVKLVVKSPQYYLSKYVLPTPAYLMTDLDEVAMYCLPPAVKAISEIAADTGIDMYEIKGEEELTYRFRMKDTCQN